MSGTLTASASAPGKAILYGEHAVVYGYPAVAAALSDMRVHAFAEASASSDELALDLADLTDEDGKPVLFRCSVESVVRIVGAAAAGIASLDAPPSPQLMAAVDELLGAAATGPAASALRPLLFLCSAIVLLPHRGGSPRRGLRVSARRARLPVGAGLGSSAAFSVACSTALVGLALRLAGEYETAAALGETLAATEGDALVAAGARAVRPGAAHLEQINRWAFAAESVIHGAPSGLDNTVSTHGGALRYVKGGGGSGGSGGGGSGAPPPPAVQFSRVEPPPALTILVTNTLVPRSTKVLVAGVRAMADRLPEPTHHVLRAMGAIADLAAPPPPSRGGAGTAASAAAPAPARPPRASELFALNHSLLRAVGVSHPALEAVVELAAARGFATKLTGAGGGGCALTLLSEGGGGEGGGGDRDGVEDDVLSAFRRYDANGNGVIDRKELRVALRGLGVDADDDAEATRVLRAYDADGDGVIDLAEFARLVRQLRGGGAPPAPPRDDVAALCAELEARGFVCLETRLGGVGAVWDDPPSASPPAPTDSRRAASTSAWLARRAASIAIGAAALAVLVAVVRSRGS